MEEIYNKWQLQDLELGNTERYQFTKSELLNFAKYYHLKQLSIHGVRKRKKKRLSVKLEEWHYQCGDGCCDMYGTEISLNGKKCNNQYAGDDVRTALEFILTELGYEVDIDVC